jgi:hypothetical protein
LWWFEYVIFSNTLNIFSMKNLSYWALMNPWKSQTLLVICHLCLAVLAIYSGVWLFAHDISVPKPVFYLGEILFFTALVLYPIRRARYKFWKANFVRQKIMDGFMVMSYVLMVVSISNTDAKLAWCDNADAPYVEQIAMRENVKPMAENAEKTPTLSRKALRREFKSFVTRMKASAASSEGNGDGGKIAGIIFLMLILESVVLVLSCAIGCSGGGAFGAIAAIGGTIAVVAFGSYLVRQIKGKRKSNYQPTPTPSNEKI